MPCRVAWFTGLSGAGKTTIANRAAEILTNRGYHVMTLDGDVVRSRLHRHLGYSREDIEENNRLIAGLCKESMGDYDVILVPIISPFCVSRDSARRMLGSAFVDSYYRISPDLADIISRRPWLKAVVRAALLPVVLLSKLLLSFPPIDLAIAFAVILVASQTLRELRLRGSRI